MVWFQGCSLGCAGCFNPRTHDDAGGYDVAIDAVVAQLSATTGIEGVTLSGGEPFQQAEAAIAVLEVARTLGLSTLAFSGYTLDEIRALPAGPSVLSLLDVLVDGRYVSAERLGSGLRGSSNQRMHRLTERYTVAELEATPVAEVRIARDGEVVLTGVNPIKLRTDR